MEVLDRTICRLQQVEGGVFDLWSLSGLSQWKFSVGSSRLFLEGSLFIGPQCQVQLNAPRGKDFRLLPCFDMFSAIFCLPVYAFYVILLGERAGVPVEWLGPVCWGRTFLSVTSFSSTWTITFYFIKAKECLFLGSKLGVSIQCSGI